MKRLLIPFITLVFISAGCVKTRYSAYTMLTEFAPYMERMNGKVAKVTERMYWAIADGDNYKKGNLVTRKERDSLKWYGDCELTFDTSGDIVFCMWPDENDFYVGIDLFYKENDKLVSGKWIWGDTLQGHAKFKCNDDGVIIHCEDYSGKPDTLNNSWTKTISKNGDTIEYQIFDNKGLLTSKLLNFYNNKGQQIGGESYDKDGVLSGLWEITYNDKGFWSQNTQFDKDKKVKAVYNRKYPKYDFKGNWKTAITKDDKGHTLFSERSYLYYR
jgi:hypothetical protein